MHINYDEVEFFKTNRCCIIFDKAVSCSIIYMLKSKIIICFLYSTNTINRIQHFAQDSKRLNMYSKMHNGLT